MNDRNINTKSRSFTLKHKCEVIKRFQRRIWTKNTRYLKTLNKQISVLKKFKNFIIPEVEKS